MTCVGSECVLGKRTGIGCAGDLPCPLTRPKYELKSWAHFYDAIVAGDKRHDLRDMRDRDFQVGDILRLRRYDNINGVYTGESCLVRVTYITSNTTPCAFSSAVLDRDYAILSLELINE